MKNIKYFKYVNEYSFERFLKDYGYKLDHVKGFSLSSVQRCNGNMLKTYIIYFNDDDDAYFKVVYFKSFNEYHQSALGFNGNKLLDGWENANIATYKYNGRNIIAKC